MQRVHRMLVRQLRRLWNLPQATDAEPLFREAETLAQQPGLSREMRSMLLGLRAFVGRVDASYRQFERDLSLRTRSLDLSSHELLDSNRRLRAELEARSRAAASLRELAESLLASAVSGHEHAVPATSDENGDELGGLAKAIGALSLRIEADRHELASLQRAVDVHAIVSVVNAEGRITYVNDRLCELTGYAKHELVGTGSRRLYDRDVHDAAFHERMRATLTGGRVWRGEVCLRARDGGALWLDTTIVPVLGDDGRPARYITIRTDVTDRRRSADLLREQLDLIDALVEGAPVPVYLLDRAGRCVRANRAFCALFDLTPQDVLERPVDPLFAAHGAAPAGGGLQEHTLVRRDGQRLHVLANRAPLRGEGGAVIGHVGTLVDITARKQAEQALHDAKEAAERASRMKSEFLANMSHEIRTPMNGVIGMTDLALELSHDERQRDYLATLRASATTLLTILNDMLDFSKIEAGHLELERTPFHLERLLRDVVQPHALRAAERGVPLDLVVDPALPPRLLGDPTRLGQVLGNLLSNAVKFTAQGRIRCSALPCAAGLRLAVADTGIGIEPTHQQRIFEPFVQAESTITRRFGGTGLGLSITRRLVDAMGGRIELRSSPGLGSEFAVELPLGAPTETVHSAFDELPGPTAPGTAPAPRGPRVLLAEDHAVNQKVVSEILRRSECSIQIAADGAEAVRLWEAGEFDVVLMDMQMPVMSGIDATREIRRREAGRSRRTPIVALTANAMPSDRERCLEAGMDDYLAKPIRPAELLDVVARCGGAARMGFDYAAALREADPETTRIIAAAFLEQAPRDIERMRAAVTERDGIVVQHLAHSMKGLLAGMHAAPARREAERLERLAASLGVDPARAADAEAALTALHGEIERLAPHLRRYA